MKENTSSRGVNGPRWIVPALVVLVGLGMWSVADTLLLPLSRKVEMRGVPSYETGLPVESVVVSPLCAVRTERDAHGIRRDTYLGIVSLNVRHWNEIRRERHRKVRVEYGPGGEAPMRIYAD